ncbi:MAG: tetratricopeptide repeat protein, partial [Nannocystaceae bacterium]
SSTLAELVASVSGGEVLSPPADAGAPGWLRKVVMRGLAVEPATRFPDMQAALAALARDPVKRRRRWLALTGLAGGSAAISAAVAMASATPAIGRCEDVAAPVAATLGEPLLAEAGRAFAATGPLGVDTWALVAPRLEGWGREWAALRGERCRAYAAGELSDALYDRSVACLDRQLARVDGLMAAFVVADERSVEQAPGAIAALPALATCADAEYLLADLTPPEGAAAREAVTAARGSIERARASVDLGRYDEALDLADAAAEVAAEHDYEPLAALAEVVRGDALQWQRDGAAAERALSSAFDHGLASGADRAAAEAVARRMFVRAELGGDAARALDDEGLGRALLRRVGGDPRLAWVLENNAAVAYERAGQLDAAQRRHEQALAIAAELGEDAAEALYSHYNLGLMLLSQSRFERADAELAAAKTLAARLLGPRHPTLVAMAEAEASAAYHAGRLRRADEVLSEARALTTNPKIALPLAELQTQVAAALRDPGLDARADETRALAAEAFGAENPRSAYTRLALKVYRPDDAAQEAADLEQLAELSAEMWGEALTHRVDARLLGGAPQAALGFLDQAKSQPTWASLPPPARQLLAGLEAEALIASGRHDEAAAALATIEPIDGGEPLPRVELARARIAAHRGEHEVAIASLRRVQADYARTFDDDHPELAEVRFALAEALRASGDAAAAEAAAQQAVTAYSAHGAAFSKEIAAIEAWRGDGS